MSDKKHIYLKLFTSTFYLSSFTFGGGFVIIPLMKEKFVDELGWIDEEEMLNLAAIAQSSPGAIAVNVAILIGYRVAGFPGALITILGTVLPPLLILSVISYFYDAFRSNIIISALLKGMQAGVAAVIIDVVIQLGLPIFKEKEWLSIVLMLGAFIATFYLNINVVYIILICGFIGGIKILLYEKHKRRQHTL